MSVSYLACFIFFIILFFFLSIQDYFPFVRNYKDKKDQEIKYSLEMFKDEMNRVYTDELKGERYFRIGYYTYQSNKIQFLARSFYPRLVFGDYIVTYVETYSVAKQNYYREFRVYYKFLDFIEIKNNVVNILGDLSIENNNYGYIDNSKLNIVISKIEKNELTYKEKKDFIDYLEKLTNLPANLATLIPMIINLLNKF